MSRTANVEAQLGSMGAGVEGALRYGELLDGIWSLLFACLIGNSQAEPLVPIRAWQFHVLDVPYVTSALDRSKDYDVNTVVYFHQMVGRVSDLYDGTNRAD